MSATGDPIKRQGIFDRVHSFYVDDLRDRAEESDLRLQRYAKYRQWTSGKDFPWDDASDAAVPDMAIHSMRMQDTIHNSVMSGRPIITAKAVESVNRRKEQAIDDLHDAQFFTEQNGESIIGELADAFINDGVFTAFIPWITETREVSDVRNFGPIPEDTDPVDYFASLLRRHMPDAAVIPVDEEGWDWVAMSEEGRTEIKFYTRPKSRRVEMVTRSAAEVYNGPRIIPKDWDDVLHPVRAANLQPPSPSNPNGAGHVIIRDYPSIDEIRRLIRLGFYDLPNKDERDALENLARSGIDEEHKQQKDVLQGVVDNRIISSGKARSHNTLTRLTCFDLMDLDGDGIDEDVIWWVIVEAKLLLKGRRMTEMYPTNPPRRPFAEASMIPVRGRRAGIGILEMIEGLHDLLKQTVDMTVDGGTITNMPFWFYRQSSGLNPTVIRMNPGEGYPLPDPERDINIPQLGDRTQSFGLNMMATINAMEEKVTTIGDLQLGRVPPGRASALRTVGGIQALSAQGDARPERILRRFYMGLKECFQQMHELNKRFLPDNKKFRILGVRRQGEDPFIKLDRVDVNGRYVFDFHANAFNASKTALQESLTVLMQTYVSDLAIQLGIIDPSGVYRLMRDFGKSHGQDPDQYLSEPTPGAMMPRIMAEEALVQIMRGFVPDGVPLEGAQAHMQKLITFAQDDRFGLLTPEQVDIFKGWLQAVRDQMQVEEERARIQGAARQFQQTMGGGNPGGRPPEGPPPNATQPPPINGGELLDETLPGAGGGGQQATLGQ